ncbi:MAG TPA: lactate racemase domain-containing protein [Negativicutes bacterium]
MSEIIEGGFTVPMPKLAPVKQLFASPNPLLNIETTINDIFLKPGFKNIVPGTSIALAVGSRGIEGIDKVVGLFIKQLKKLGALPFIVPAMGSHGGATAEGQLQVLKNYGITAETMGAPIRSSMKVEKIGTLANGLPVYLDSEALKGDGIIVINRIKPHTGFRGDFESGLLKMLAIGLGKHVGATTFHNCGLDKFAEDLPQIGQLIIDSTPLIGGLAILENAYHQTVGMEFLWAEEILRREKELLLQAKKLMPKILVDNIDVLIVNDFGKEISGPGMDPNVTGRPVSPYIKLDNVINISKLVVLNLTPASKGNAVGIGVADVTTKKFVDSIDLEYTYANSITSTFLNSAKIPIYLNNDFEAIQVALKACPLVTHPNSRVVWIKNTLQLDQIFVSEALLPEIKGKSDLKITGEPKAMEFDKNGNLSYPFL